MFSLMKSLQIASRSLRRRPLLTLVAILTLGLGIGASTAIYTVLQATLLSPLPYTTPEQLVALWGVFPTRNVDSYPLSPPEIESYRQEARLFQDVAGFVGNNHVLRTEGGRPEQVVSTLQTWNLFRLLGVSPWLGRDFTVEDARFNQSEVPPGTQPPNDVFNPTSTIILGHNYWTNRFGADPGVVGSQVYLDELPVTVIGIMPEGFKLLLPQVPNTPDIFEVVRVDNENAPLTNVFLRSIGRLQAGVSLDQATAEINSISVRITERAPVLQANQYRVRLSSLPEEMVRDIRTIVWVLAGAVGFILLIACANVSNLLLIQAGDRRNEHFIRVALGSSRLRLTGESLLETGLLALGGTVLGVVVAYGSLPVLLSLQPQNIPQLADLSVDLSILAFAVLAALIATLLSGSLPAMSAAGTVKDSGLTVRGASKENPTSRRTRNVLIVAEVALSFVLLIGAGLMTRSFFELQVMDPGFEPEGVLTFNYNLPAARFRDLQSQLEFHRQFARRVRALPGVEAVGGTFPLPFSGGLFGSRYSTDLASFTDGSARQAEYRGVYPGYFETVKTALVRGRLFTDQDERSAARYALVSEALARRSWPDQDPLGKQIYIRGATPDPVEFEVIGVVQNQKQQQLNEEPLEIVYATTSVIANLGFGAFTSWAVRVQGDPGHSTSAIEGVLAEMDQEVPLQFVSPLQELVDQSAAPTRFAMTLIGVFSALATFLVAIGLYGVLAYRVKQQGPELGIRLAFGATRAGIFRVVLRSGLLLALAGLGIGVVGALGLSRAMTSLLIGVTPSDPVTYILIALFFGLVAAVSCLLPAYRATRIDPVQILRQQA